METVTQTKCHRAQKYKCDFHTYRTVSVGERFIIINTIETFWQAKQIYKQQSYLSRALFACRRSFSFSILISTGSSSSAELT